MNRIKNKNDILLSIMENDKCYEKFLSATDLENAIKETEDDKVSFILKSKEGKDKQIFVEEQQIQKLLMTIELRKSLIPFKLTPYFIDITQRLAMQETIKAEGRSDEVKKIWTNISKKIRSNAILVGDIGVGKTTTAFEIARQIVNVECSKEFLKYRVILFDVKELLKDNPKSFGYEKKLSNILNFIMFHKDRCIFYIDDLTDMLYEEPLIDILTTLLKTSEVKLIASVNEQQYEEYFMNDYLITRIGKYLNKVEIIEPRKEELMDMIKETVRSYQSKYRVHISLKMIQYAIRTARLSNSCLCEPANVLDVLDKAFSEAKRCGNEVVTRENILSCYERSKIFDRNEENGKLSTAYHEMGHYLLFRYGKHLKNVIPDLVSIIPTDQFYGITMTHYDFSKYTDYDREFCEDLISVDLAGRIAEAKVTKTYSSGAAGDLESATEIAKEMIMIYGISDEQSSKNRSYSYNFYAQDDAFISEKKKELFDEEIAKTIQKCYEHTENVLDEHSELLERLVQEIMEKEILTAEELDKICEEYEK